MKGNNTLVFSHVTVIEAIQQYLDAQFKVGLSPVVQSVHEKNNGFEVETAERPEVDKVSEQ